MNTQSLCYLLYVILCLLAIIFIDELLEKHCNNIETQEKEDEKCFFLAYTFYC